MENKSNYRLKLIASTVSACFLVSGCSFDKDEDSDETVNLAPTVAISGQSEIQEKTSFSLTASASDSDGQIVNYYWQHDSTLNLSAQNPNSNEITYLSPDITEDVTVNFTVTVEDDDGATTNATQQVLIKRNSTAVTLNGLITDNTISFANVEITIGDKTYSATADENGIYTVALDVDEALDQTLVKVKAKGRDDLNPGVEFISQLSSVKKLATQAGDDGILDSNENFGVNTTNVTTAEYALIVRDGNEPTSEDELDNALLNVDADEKVQLASLIKIIVDNPDYELPEGVENTLDLVINEEAAEQFEEYVNEQDPDLIEQTKAEIKEDEDLVTGSKEMLIGEYIINSPRYYANAASHLTLNENGTGQYHAVTGSSLTWQEVSGKIEVTLQSPVLINKYSQIEDDVETVSEEYLNSFSLQVLGENDVFKTIDIKSDITVYENSVEVQNKQEIQTTNLILKSKTLSLTVEDIVGEWEMQRSESRDFINHLETIAFYEDGTGAVLSDNSAPFEWELANNKLIVTYDENGNLGAIHFWFTKNLKAGYQLVSLDTSSVEPANSQYGLMIKREAVSLSNDDLVGRWQGFIGTSQLYDMNVFADGTIMLGLGTTSFQGVLEDGNLIRRRYKYEGYTVSSCEGFNETCYLSAEVTHDIIAVEDSHYYILREFKWFSPEGDMYDIQKNLLIYRYSKELSYSEFTPNLLQSSFNLYKSAGEQVIEDRIRANFDDGSFTITIDGIEYEAQLNEGVIEYQKNGQTWLFEIVSGDGETYTICNYQQGNSCTQSDKIVYQSKNPRVTLTALSNEFGQLQPAVQEVPFSQLVGFNIVPNEGYEVDSIEGCEGYIEGEYYIAFSGHSDCEINATFVEKPETISGQFLINNPDYFTSTSFKLELNENEEGTFTGNNQVALTWYKYFDEIRVYFSDEYVLSESVSYEAENGTQVEVRRKDVMTGIVLKERFDLGNGWYEMTQSISKFRNEELVEEWQSDSHIKLFDSVVPQIDLTSNDLVGSWSLDIPSEDTVKELLLNDDGTGSVVDTLDEAQIEDFTWQKTSVGLQITTSGGVEDIYVTKNIDLGYQVIMQSQYEDQKQVSVAVMIRLEEKAITPSNFVGRHLFKEGHGLESIWDEIQIYDDGQVFFTYSTSSIQGEFKEGSFSRSRKYDQLTDTYGSDCDLTLDTCFNDYTMDYRLINRNDDYQVVERVSRAFDTNTGEESFSYASLYFENYIENTSTDKFHEHEIPFEIYEQSGENFVKWGIHYVDGYELWKNDIKAASLELAEGKFTYEQNGQSKVIEFISNDRDKIVLCEYVQGTTCQNQEEMTFTIFEPRYDVTVYSDGNGVVNNGVENYTSFHGDTLTFNIVANAGYKLESISGCDGVLEENIYTVHYLSQSCDINIAFELLE